MNRDLLGILKDRRLWTGPAIFVVVALVAVNLWAARWRVWLDESQKKAAAGTGSEQVLLSTEKTARYDMSLGEDLDQYWPTIPDARKTHLTILSGMSQMHAINDRQPGDQLICQWLDDAVAASGGRVWGFAAPNLCNEEAVFQLVSLAADPSTRPKTFIYGLCFDKMRNIDLRPGYEKFLRSRPKVQEAWEQTAQRYKDRYPAAAEKMMRSLEEIRKSAQQKEETFESKLRARTEQLLPLVASRKDLNSQAQFALYHLRNKLLNIKPTTKRPMIGARLDMNWQFLHMLVEVARENGVRPIFYIIPLNPQGDNPYVPAEYAAYKEQCEKFCAEEKIPFANFEDVVPADKWGLFLGGPDFKHFRGAGHKITAAAIMNRFGGELIGKNSQFTGAAR